MAETCYDANGNPHVGYETRQGPFLTLDVPPPLSATQTMTGWRHVHTIPIGARYYMLGSGRIIVCPKDAEPYIAEPDGSITPVKPEVSAAGYVYIETIGMIVGLPAGDFRTAVAGDPERW